MTSHETFLAASDKGIGPGVIPDIAAVAPEAAELDVVAVPAAAPLEDKDELVPAAVERAHPGIVLDPDAEVLQLAINAAPGRCQLFDMAPIHADEVDRAVSRERRQVVESLLEKVGELSACPSRPKPSGMGDDGPRRGRSHDRRSARCRADR